MGDLLFSLAIFTAFWMSAAIVSKGAATAEARLAGGVAFAARPPCFSCAPQGDSGAGRPMWGWPRCPVFYGYFAFLTRMTEADLAGARTSSRTRSRSPRSQHTRCHCPAYFLGYLRCCRPGK